MYYLQENYAKNHIIAEYNSDNILLALIFARIDQSYTSIMQSIEINYLLGD